MKTSAKIIAIARLFFSLGYAHTGFNKLGPMPLHLCAILELVAILGSFLIIIPA